MRRGDDMLFGLLGGLDAALLRETQKKKKGKPGPKVPVQWSPARIKAALPTEYEVISSRPLGN